MAKAYGNTVNNDQVVYAFAEAAITLEEPGSALCVVYTGDEYGEIEVPGADGVEIAGFLYSNAEAGKKCDVAKGRQFWVPVAEAISIGDRLMCEITTGRVKVATTGKFICGTALTAQATVAGFVLVDAKIGPQEA